MNIYMVRSEEDFVNHLTAWSATPMVFCDETGVCGYCTLHPEEGSASVSELRLREPELLVPFLSLLLDQGYSDLKITITPDAPEYALASVLCEYYKIGTNHNIRVFQFAPLAEALLAWKNRRFSLPQGQMELAIEDFGRLNIKVDGEGAEVRLAEEAAAQQLVFTDAQESEEAVVQQSEDASSVQRKGNQGAGAMVLSYEQAVHVLFSPLSPEREQLIGREPLAASWLPLPLYIEENDCY